jgi:hypothetical protein
MQPNQQKVLYSETTTKKHTEQAPNALRTKFQSEINQPIFGTSSLLA